MLVAACAAGCRAGGPAPAAPLPKRAEARGALGEWTARWDASSGVLDVEARVHAGAGTRFEIERGVEAFVHDVSAEGGRGWIEASREGASFVLPPCAGECRLRYRVALREAARSIDDLDVASEEGDAVVAPPSSWILAPRDAAATARLRFRVETSAGSRFVTGVFRAPGGADAWELALGDLWTSPYSAFGTFRTRAIDAPGARIELAVGAGRLAVSDEAIAAWTRDAARAVAVYFGRFPMREALVVVMPARGPWVGGGRTLSGGGGTVFVRLGARANDDALARDWVLVHEMTHLAFPSVSRAQAWAEEGLATYVEPFARTRAGLLSAEEAWRGLALGLPNGLPGPDDRGLDRTPTWGRTYWGGALFYLLADIEIRKGTDNERGLEHALRGILDAGGSNAVRWPLEQSFSVGDAAAGATVLTRLHEAMGASPHPLDLDALLRSLGVHVSGEDVTLSDDAPLAPIRRAITRGS